MFSRFINYHPLDSINFWILLESMGFDLISMAVIELIRASIAYNNMRLLEAIHDDSVKINDDSDNSASFNELLEEPGIDLQFKFSVVSVVTDQEDDTETKKAAGKTLLQYAVERCCENELSTEIDTRRQQKVLALVRKGASLTTIDKEGYTPISRLGAGGLSNPSLFNLILEIAEFSPPTEGDREKYSFALTHAAIDPKIPLKTFCCLLNLPNINPNPTYGWSPPLTLLQNTLSRYSASLLSTVGSSSTHQKIVALVIKLVDEKSMSVEDIDYGDRSPILEFALAAEQKPELWEWVEKILQKKSGSLTNLVSLLTIAIKEKKFDLSGRILQELERRRPRVVPCYEDGYFAGYTALHFAVKANNRELLERLFRLSTTFPDFGILNFQQKTKSDGTDFPTALILAAMDPEVSLDTLALLLTQSTLNPELTYRGRTALQWAVHNCFVSGLIEDQFCERKEKLLALVNKGVSLSVINKQNFGKTPIVELACGAQKDSRLWEVVSEIGKARSPSKDDPEKYREVFPLAMAAKQYELLLQQNSANQFSFTDKTGYTVFHEAVKKNDIVFAGRLLSGNSQVLNYQVDGDFPTALIFAMINSQVSLKTFQFLLNQEGINPELTYHGRTALQWASRYCFRSELLQQKILALVNKRASLAVKDEKGTPLVALAEVAETHPAFWSLIQQITQDRPSSKGDPEDYSRVIVHAVKAKHYDLARKLLDLNCDNKPAAIQGCTALHFAVRDDDLKLAEILLKKADLLNYQDDNAPSALIEATMNPKVSFEMLQLLLKQPDLNFDLTYQGKTAFDWVSHPIQSLGVQQDIDIQYDKLNFFAQVFRSQEARERQAAMRTKGYSELHSAIEKNDVSAVTKLLNDPPAHLINFQIKGFPTALILVLTTGTSQEILTLLLAQRGIDLELKWQDKTALQWAVERYLEEGLMPELLSQRRAIVMALIQQGAFPDVINCFGETPIVQLAKKVEEDSELWGLVKAMVQKNPSSVNFHVSSFPTLLILAIKHADFETFQFLLEQTGIDPELTHEGKTALQWAVEKCLESELDETALATRKKIVLALVRKGASLVVKNQQGFAPIAVLSEAAKSNSSLWDFVNDIALEKHATEGDPEQYSFVLLNACSENKFEIAQILLGNLSIYLENKCRHDNGYFPIHYTVLANETKFLADLLKKNNCLNFQKNGNFPTALILAAKESSVSCETLQFLLDQPNIDLALTCQGKSALQWAIDSNAPFEKISKILACYAKGKEGVERKKIIEQAVKGVKWNAYQVDSRAMLQTLLGLGVDYSVLTPTDKYAQEILEPLKKGVVNIVSGEVGVSRFFLTPQQYLKFVCNFTDEKIVEIATENPVAAEAKKSIQSLSNGDICRFLKLLTTITEGSEETLLIEDSQGTPSQEKAFNKTSIQIYDEKLNKDLLNMAREFAVKRDASSLEKLVPNIPGNVIKRAIIPEPSASPTPFDNWVDNYFRKNPDHLKKLPSFCNPEEIKARLQRKRLDDVLTAIKDLQKSLRWNESLSPQNCEKLFTILDNNPWIFEREPEDPLFKLCFAAGWHLKRMRYSFRGKNFLETGIGVDWDGIDNFALSDLLIIRTAKNENQIYDINAIISNLKKHGVFQDPGLPKLLEKNVIQAAIVYPAVQAAMWVVHDKKLKDLQDNPLQPIEEALIQKIMQFGQDIQKEKGDWLPSADISQDSKDSPENKSVTLIENFNAELNKDFSEPMKVLNKRKYFLPRRGNAVDWETLFTERGAGGCVVVLGHDIKQYAEELSKPYTTTGLEGYLKESRTLSSLELDMTEGHVSEDLLKMAKEQLLLPSPKRAAKKAVNESVLVESISVKERKKIKGFDPSLLSYSGNPAVMFGAKSPPAESLNAEQPPQMTNVSALVPG